MDDNNGMAVEQTSPTMALYRLRTDFQGEILVDELDRLVYSTDASVYQELPLAVTCPKNENDVRLLIDLANETGVGLIPRAAGTSLAGQVVGAGIVVDVSRFMTKVLEVNVAEGWVRVQPGVIRDELNLALAEHGLFFGPETSTSNRATIGGMLGNNSCGSNSIVYGATRDQTLEVTGFLSDGSRVVFAEMNYDEVVACLDETEPTSRSRIVQAMVDLLTDEELKERIRAGFPKPAVTRRNTGYAIDRLLDSLPEEGMEAGKEGLNLCHLIAGSEGTLFFATEIKLRCHQLLKMESGLFCPHFKSLDDALQATRIVMRHARKLALESALEKGEAGVFACELIDRFILEGAARNIEQKKNLQFVTGDPEAILIVDLRSADRSAICAVAKQLQTDLEDAGTGFEFPTFFDDGVKSIRDLRKAGLGVVANVIGDAKPVTVIEDTAVAVDDLPEFIGEVGELLETKYQTRCVHYGHAGAGEIHLRPLLNLKTDDGVRRFRQIATDVARIVKKFGGSLSGEHGDGRLRGEFLEFMVGEANFEVLRQIKEIWDPPNLFNPGKIIDTPPMTGQLRFQADARNADMEEEIETTFDFSDVGGLQRAAEMCSGSGDCRKTQLSGGVMCPSYMATRNEKDTTRARANVLRQVLTGDSTDNPLTDERIKEVMDLCLSCKGCKTECPSNVDVAKMKAEFLSQYYQEHGVPRRARLFADYAGLGRRASKFPRLSNWLASGKLMSGILKRYMGVHPKRSMPPLHRTTLRNWFASHDIHQNAGRHGAVLLFCDEFTNYHDIPAGIAAIQLLERFGFSVELPEHDESGRAAISQGLLTKARRFAERNVSVFEALLAGNNKPIIGIEPSALLAFRDEYPALVTAKFREIAEGVAKRVFLIDEFVSQLIEDRTVSSDVFSDESRTIRLHGHCHQKALSSMRATIRMLQLPRNYQVKLIPSGCCGMAGAFGFEKEHYDVSMQIGELVLFPAIRDEPQDSIIAAGGTSCRHQILDGTGRIALHPVQVLMDSWRGG